MVQSTRFITFGSIMVAALFGCGTPKPKPRGPTIDELRVALLVEALETARLESRRAALFADQSTIEPDQLRVVNASVGPARTLAATGPQGVGASSSRSEVAAQSDGSSQSEAAPQGEVSSSPNEALPQSEAPSRAAAVTAASSAGPLASQTNESVTDRSGTGNSSASGAFLATAASPPDLPDRGAAVISSAPFASVQKPPGAAEEVESVAPVVSQRSAQQLSSAPEPTWESDVAELTPSIRTQQRSAALVPTGDEPTRIDATPSDADRSISAETVSAYEADAGYTGIYAGESGATGIGAGTGYTGIGAGDGFTGVGAGSGYTGAGAGSRYTGIGAEDLGAMARGQRSAQNGSPSQTGLGPATSPLFILRTVPAPWMPYAWSLAERVR